MANYFLVNTQFNIQPFLTVLGKSADVKPSPDGIAQAGVQICFQFRQILQIKHNLLLFVSILISIIYIVKKIEINRCYQFMRFFFQHFKNAQMQN